MLIETQKTIDPAVFDKLHWVAGEVAVYEGLLLFRRDGAIHTIGTATATTITVTAAQHGVMNLDGTWTVEEWEAPDAEEAEI